VKQRDAANSRKRCNVELSNESKEKAKCIVAVDVVAVVWQGEIVVVVVVVSGRSAHLRKRRGARSLRLAGRHALAP